MKSNRRHKIILSFLLAVFCWQLGNTALFLHTHVVDGVVVCHAHPYTGTSDNPGHGHTKVQFDTIAHLSVFTFLVAVLLGIFQPFTGRIREHCNYRFVPVSETAVRIGLLRGPPYR